MKGTHNWYVTDVQRALDSGDDIITDSRLRYRKLKGLCLNDGRFSHDYSMTLPPPIALYFEGTLLQVSQNLLQTPLHEPVRQANIIAPLYSLLQ